VRVNPDVDAETHEKIATGKAENKFGVPFDAARALYAHARSLPAIDVTGVHMHIGSQITRLSPFRTAFQRMASLVCDLRADGHRLTHLDLGGGLGVPYRGSDDIPPAPGDYASVVREVLGGLGLKVVLEPGRMIAANAGIFVVGTVFSKEGAERTFTIVDGAMNDLLRPTLYEAHHEVWPLTEPAEGDEQVWQDIVGPVCETGDYLAKGRLLPHFSPGDRIAVMTAGAYGAVMSSTYNTRPLVPEVLVRGAEFSVVRERIDVPSIIAWDNLAPWQK